MEPPPNKSDKGPEEEESFITEFSALCKRLLFPKVREAYTELTQDTLPELKKSWDQAKCTVKESYDRLKQKKGSSEAHEEPPHAEAPKETPPEPPKTPPPPPPVA